MARGLGQRRNVNFLQRVQVGGDAQVAVQLVDRVQELAGQFDFGFTLAAHPRAHGERGEAPGDGRGRVLEHMRQHDGVG